MGALLVLVPVHFDPSLRIESSMGTRNRSIVYRQPGGSRYMVSADIHHIVSAGIDSATTHSGTKNCADVTSTRPYPDHTLTITDKKLLWPRLHGTGRFQGGSRLWDATFTGWRCPPFPIGSYPAAPAPAWGYYLTKALANANPNKPVVDSPVFFSEFKDFPGMVRGLGEVLARRAGASDIPGGYLAGTFGWGPLFNDLKALLDLADEAARLKALLLKAAKKGGTKVRRRLGTNQFPSSESLVYSTSIDSTILLKGYWTYEGHEDWWTTYRLSLISKLDFADLDTKVFRVLLGLNSLSAASLWQALPWTFLIDYFVNIGDALEASRGGIQYRVTNLNLMCHQKYTGTWHTTQKVSGGFQVFPGRYSYEYKGRRLPTLLIPLPHFRPFWTNRMSVIVGALALAGAFRSVR